MAIPVYSLVGPNTGANYSSFAEWYAARKGNLITRDTCEIVNFQAYEDTTNISMLSADWTTDVDHWVLIQADPATITIANSAIWSTERYINSYQNSSYNQDNKCEVPYVTYNYIQRKIDHVYYDGLTLNSANIVVKNSLFRVLSGANTAGGELHCIRGLVNSSTIYRTICWTEESSSGSHGIFGAPLLSVNCTVIGFSIGYVSSTARNCISQKRVGGLYDFYEGSGNYNISLDNTAPGSNSKRNVSPIFRNAANRDYRLALSDTIAKDAGTDLGSPYNVDICGTPVPKNLGWDIGAYELPRTQFPIPTFLPSI
jgi:hypothetical protein